MIAAKIEEHLALERNVLALSLTAGIMSFTSWLWSPFIALYMEELGATPVEVGLMYSAQLLAYVVMSIPFGYLADSFGRKTLIVFGTVFLGLTELSYAHAPSWPWLLATMVLLGAVHASYMGAFNAIIADSVPSERRATAFASLNLISGIISMPGPFLGGYLYEVILRSFKPFFLISGVTAVAMAFVRIITLRETLSARVSLRDSLHKFSEKFPGDFRDAVLGERSTTSLLLSSCIGSLAFGVLGYGMMMGSAFMVLYAEEVMSLTVGEIGTWQGVSSIAWLLSQIPCAKLADKFGKKRSLILGGLVGFPATLGFVFSRNVLQASMCAVLFSVTGATYFTARSAFIADLTPLEKRATTLSVFTALESLFSSPGPVVGGFMYRNMSPQAPFYTYMVLEIPALATLILLVKEPKRN